MAAAVVIKNMQPIWKRRFWFSISLALAACLLSWFIVGVNSPLADYFLRHLTILNLWQTIHTAPYLIMVIFRPAVWGDAILYLLVFPAMVTHWFSIIDPNS